MQGMKKLSASKALHIIAKEPTTGFAKDVGVCLEEIKLDGDVEARELERGYVAFDTKDDPAKGVASFTSDGDRHEPS
ncbi:hypothetical protein Tco_1357908 [Tanacetum coccineum]